MHIIVGFFLFTSYPCLSPFSYPVCLPIGVLEFQIAAADSKSKPVVHTDLLRSAAGSMGFRGHAGREKVEWM